MFKTSNKFSDRDGFTLVELMIALVVSAISAIAIFAIFVGTQESYYDTRSMVGETGDVRVVMTLLANEVRSAGSDAVERDIAGDGIVDATPTSLSLRSDLDGDQSIEFTEPPEMVTYAFNTGTGVLTRNTGAGDAVLLRNLENLRFTYLDRDGQEVDLAGGGTTGNIRSVRVQVWSDRGDGDIDLQQGTFTLRNR